MMKRKSGGTELARSWLRWALNLQEVIAIDLDKLVAQISLDDGATSTVAFVIDPDLLRTVFDALVKEGAAIFGADAGSEEIAWRMLSVDLFECLGSMEDGVTTLKLAGGPVTSVIPA